MTDPPAFSSDLRAWIKRMGYTRAQAAAVLRVPTSTLDGWCAGRPCVLEGAIKLLMDLLAEKACFPSAPNFDA